MLEPTQWCKESAEKLYREHTVQIGEHNYLLQLKKQLEEKIQISNIRLEKKKASLCTAGFHHMRWTMAANGEFRCECCEKPW